MADARYTVLVWPDEQPDAGRIVIDWRRVPADVADSFDWHISFDPPGLSDEDAANLLKAIAERL